SKGGRFSAVLLPPGLRLAFTGRLDADGTTTKTITHGGTNAFVISLELVTSNGIDQVIGTVAGNDWLSYLWAGRDASGSPALPFAMAGRYTLALPGADEDSDAPAGHGFGSLTVDARGRLSVAATLGD